MPHEPEPDLGQVGVVTFDREIQCVLLKDTQSAAEQPKMPAKKTLSDAELEAEMNNEEKAKMLTKKTDSLKRELAQLEKKHEELRKTGAHLSLVSTFMFRIYGRHAPLLAGASLFGCSVCDPMCTKILLKQLPQRKRNKRLP